MQVKRRRERNRQTDRQTDRYETRQALLPPRRAGLNSLTTSVKLTSRLGQCHVAMTGLNPSRHVRLLAAVTFHFLTTELFV